ncbi:MAG: DUF2497 domain-containing protein [Pseudomonadota bacterium]|nr:DUF2497 domain-containing protein [Pseudomonadota bacterium]
MSDQNAQEPTMEEILASIRRIISEDEPAPSAEAESASPPHGDERSGYAEDEDILELTEPLESVESEPSAGGEETGGRDIPQFETSGDLDIYARSGGPESARAEPSSDFAEEDPPLVSAPVETTASSAFGQLARTVTMPAQGRVLEDVVRELLRPMLKDWLDRNLPEIVEAAVQAEVERIARRRLA